MRTAKVFLVVLATLGGVVWTSTALAAGRVALVIGNSTYTRLGQLRNPENDAADMASALRRLGFQVTIELDTDRVELTEALRNFTRSITGADVSLVFYAGHGIEMEGINYLIPVDARLERDVDVRYETVTVSDLLMSTRGASLRVVILDACRNNPLARSMQRTVVTRGLNLVPGSFANLDESLLGDETLVAYAAAAGTTAADGRGRNSPYTSALLSRLEEPLEILTFFRRVRADVLEATDGWQRPHEYQSLLRDHYLGGTPAIASVTPRPAGSIALETDPVIESAAPAAAYTAVRELDVAGLRELAENGSPSAQTELGHRYRRGEGVDREYREAATWFRRAAGQGFPPAQVAIGLAYYYGQGVPQDYRAAVAWYRFAAEQGYRDAQFSLGSVYANGGTLVPPDDRESVKWYRLAANQEHAGAQHNLGMMYLEGRGVPQDDAAAVLWIRRAAELGEVKAQMGLGSLYELGQVVEEDLDEAAQWYRLAADQGNEEAQQKLDRLQRGFRSPPCL